MSQAWPYQAAGRIRSQDDVVVFETGYGPSGLPHIGTFTEVLRTTWVQRAFEEMTGRRTRLICFSDDMDAMRRVPDNVPNREMMEQHVGRSLTRVPDPFGCCESFAHHNNRMLCDFLDDFGFDYEFMSSTDLYTGGVFDRTLLNILDNLDAVNDIIKPTLGEERRATYCPFMPILPDGRVIHEGFLDVDGGELLFEVDGEKRFFGVTGGQCKLQWKVDWAMRWMALGVGFEMAGKDLIDSVTLSSKIVRALGHQPPANIIYEMFLDAEGRKISKSLGNGLSIDEWLTYGPRESLAYYLYREPQKAKALHVGLIPRAIDEYHQARDRYHGLAIFNAPQSPDQQRGNPLHHIHRGDVPTETIHPVSFGLLLNLIGILVEPDEEMVLGYIRANYAADVGDEVRRLIPYALRYHRDHVAGTLEYRAPVGGERGALMTLVAALRQLDSATSPEDIQAVIYQVGKDTGYADDLRGWFRVVYEVVFGSSDGPRLGMFISLYGIDEFVDLIERRMADAYRPESISA